MSGFKAGDRVVVKEDCRLVQRARIGGKPGLIDGRCDDGRWKVIIDDDPNRARWFIVETDLEHEPKAIPTLEENQDRLRQQQAGICKRLGYSLSTPEVKPDRDSIADLARTALWAIEYAHVLFPVSSIADAKKSVELIIAECTKP